MSEVDIYDNFLRHSALPTIWCPGCGNGIVLAAAIRAIEKMGWEKDAITAVSGIGCSSRAPSYIDVNSVQTTHGRAIAFATGIKMQKPEMNVVLFLGDGDCGAIGGNHFIHAAKRNIDMTVIVMNNYTYGMTGGQVSPTTPYNSYSSTSPFGSLEREIDLCRLAQAAGASFVARTTACHTKQLAKYIESGMKNQGFSVIECITPCPTGFGRRNGFRKVVEMYERLRKNSISLERSLKLGKQDLEGKIITGIFEKGPKPEFVHEYYEMLRRVAQNYEDKEFSLPVCETQEKVDHFEIRLSGSGGQGLVLAGVLLGEACITLGKNAVHSQSYGPEARGGASKSEVIVSDDAINFPEVICPDVLLTMTESSYIKYSENVKQGGVILVDSSRFNVPARRGVKVYSFPISEKAANDFGNLQAANVIALGILASIVSFLRLEALESAVNRRLGETNSRALKMGFEYGQKLIHS